MTDALTRIWLGSDTPTDADLQEMADRFGMDVVDLRQAMTFRAEMQAIANRLGLEPPQIICCAMNVLSEILMDRYQGEQRNRVVSDLIDELSKWRDEYTRLDEADEVTH